MLILSALPSTPVKSTSARPTPSSSPLKRKLAGNALDSGQRGSPRSRMSIEFRSYVDLVEDAPSPRKPICLDAEECVDEVVLRPDGELELVVKRGVTVELVGEKFVYVLSIVRRGDSAAIRGHQFVRTREMGGRLPKKQGELCWLLNTEHSDPIAEYPIDQVRRIRELRVTNRPFPECSYRETDAKVGYSEDESPLVVRWVYDERPGGVKKEKVLRRLMQGDSLMNSALAIEDRANRRAYRGPTRAGGSFLMDQTASPSSSSKRPAGQKYTYADACEF